MKWHWLPFGKMNVPSENPFFCVYWMFVTRPFFNPLYSGGRYFQMTFCCIWIEDWLVVCRHHTLAFGIFTIAATTLLAAHSVLPARLPPKTHTS